MERCLYTGTCTPPDLVIRTSGEVRLSDFLTWQSSYFCLCFQNVLWLEFSIWNLFSSILTYQQNYSSIKVARDYMYIERKDKQYKSDRDCALVQYYKERGGGGGEGELSEAVLEELISHYAAERQKRTELFVQSLIKKINNYLETVIEQ
ncbi:PREDICTED: dehydrodolichyl diphosphate synthase complex subunit DHDDS-like [Amphimedon queenslandica]|nr:PREDICTED: dehydrodolichyl diphosphate synthase complex subunit DHDDS-like [Amphimedon queenslandica]|eukprot:XP_019858007.1 PREDICTED: dehydrodolichyl diphosphate synthase complex subunit DHDDS-like [Amphimedon queenslandica]